MSNPSAKFSKEQKDLIVRAIKDAELNTSGEIRVHIENNCPEDVMDRAAYWFAKLKMHKTELRNGVLFYLALNHRKFAILGDIGINSVVPENFWNDTKEAMLPYYAEGNFADDPVWASGFATSSITSPSFPDIRGSFSKPHLSSTD